MTVKEIEEAFKQCKELSQIDNRLASLSQKILELRSIIDSEEKILLREIFQN